MQSCIAAVRTADETNGKSGWKYLSRNHDRGRAHVAATGVRASAERFAAGGPAGAVRHGRRSTKAALLDGRAVIARNRLVARTSSPRQVETAGWWIVFYCY